MRVTTDPAGSRHGGRAWLILSHRRSHHVAIAGLLALSLTAGGEVGQAYAQEAWPTQTWPTATPFVAGMQAAKLTQAVNYAKARGGAGLIARGGKRVRSWGDQAKPYPLYSSTKSIGSILLGLAIRDQLVGLGMAVRPMLPALGTPPTGNAGTGWLPFITVEQLATHTAGFEKTSGFGALLFQPGTEWSYSDGGPNWLADLLTVRFGRDLSAVLTERVLTPLGIAATSLTWRTPNTRPPLLSNGLPRREFSSGISANVDALARIGLMLSRDGRWQMMQILPPGYVAEASRGRASLAPLTARNPGTYGNAPQHYGLLFWTNADGTMKGVPTDAFWAWGLKDSFILVIPSLDLVASRAGNPWDPTWGSYATLEPFFTLLAQAVNRTNKAPVADAGADITIKAPGTVALFGRVHEDGLPSTGFVTSWNVVQAPTTVSLADPSKPYINVSLPAVGIYVFRLTANDGQLSGQDDVVVKVGVP